jgi:hypothetical protein
MFNSRCGQQHYEFVKDAIGFCDDIVCEEARFYDEETKNGMIAIAAPLLVPVSVPLPIAVVSPGPSVVSGAPPTIFAPQGTVDAATSSNSAEETFADFVEKNARVFAILRGRKAIDMNGNIIEAVALAEEETREIGDAVVQKLRKWGACK